MFNDKTNAIASVVTQRLGSMGMLCRDTPNVQLRHESEGLVARFYVAGHEANGRMVVRVAIDRDTTGAYTVDSIAKAITDAAVEQVGLTVAQGN